MKDKKLYRNKQNAMIFGVCAGLADYFEVDVTLVRIVWVFSLAFAGGGLLAYIIAAIVMPLNPQS